MAYKLKIQLTFLTLLLSAAGFAQLGFCPGSKSEPLFSENFGNGTTYGPALSPGITTYTFVTGAPNDGQYTLHNNSYQYTTWHNAPDHTPDATNGANGKMLLMNANAVTSGDFYKKTVTGLCVNTTFEFSAWVMNVYNPNSNYCGAGQIPINVRFEIWNAAETILLGSGNTGNIYGSSAPTWQQFALVFTTVSETSVVLKMKNNGLGGCGNDLAIDDIAFSACGDVTTVSSPSAVGDVYSTCAGPVSLQLHAVTGSAVPYSYQWQVSTDGTTWTDVAGETNAFYATPNLTSTTYYRVKAAQDPANLANIFCSTLSNVFTISVLPGPNPATSNGDITICSGDPIPALSVSAPTLASVNWYDAPAGGSLLQANSITYTPTSAGTYYAETYNITNNCIGSPRTPVQLTILPLPDATMTGTASICGGNTAVVNFDGTPNAIVTYSDGVTNHTITLNASGLATFTTPVLTATTTYTLVSVASPILSICTRPKTDVVTITVNNAATAAIATDAPVCQGAPATVTFTGTPNATVSYSAGAASQSIILDASGNASVTIPSVTTPTVYALNSVSVGGSCTQSLSQSVTVSAMPLPTVLISANPTSVCSGETSTITFTGTPNAIVTYTVGGANHSVTLNASGTASLTTSALNANAVYALVGVTLNACTNNVNNSVTVTVNPMPTASISGSSPVCSGSAATVDFIGTPNATVSYSDGSATHSVVLTAAGTGSLVIPNVTAATTYTLISVVSAGANGCTKPLSQSFTVSAAPLPTATIGADPSSVCSGQTSTISFTGTPNAVVTYSDGISKTVTLNATGTATVTATPPSAGVTYQLISVALGSCSQALSGSATVSVNAAPNVSYSGDLVYCDGESVAIALSSTLAGATFSWTVSENGTTGAAAGTGNQIAQSLNLDGNIVGTATYTVTPFYNGCSGSPVAITVTVYPLPVPKITDGVICTTSSATQTYLLDTGLSAADHTFQWFFGTNQIPGAFGSTYNAAQVGVYTVIATNASGCVSDPVSATVGQMPQGESLIVEHSPAFSDNPTVNVTVVGGGGPFLYQMDNGPFQPSNVFYNVPDGTHTITVVDDNCTNLSGSVTIINYPKFFTPNGDGFHETWNVWSMDDAVIWIFDRYGKLLKQISSEGFGWDGTYNGQPMPSSDYWFVIDYFENGASKTFNAHFSLKR